MPRYFFHYHDGIHKIDVEGMELADLSAARIEAVQYAGHLFRDCAHSIARGDDWHLDVADARGLILFRLDFLATDAPVTRPDPLTGH